uniref:GATA type zinc finger protein asd-4 n=1 Tax=Ganoderma boninense TaxID=34458 RepID=A0A5K1JW26_9APHY|nr:GATA type zinc finger protein asd-4 [Ganoderma boninense]
MRADVQADGAPQAAPAYAHARAAIPVRALQEALSRSDNLAQHVRTHDRRAVAAAAASGLVVEMQEVEGEVEVDELLEGDADVEDQLDYLSGSRGITSVRMCEVEVQGQVHEVQGDEEGLVTTTGAIAPAPASVGVAETQEMYFDQIQQPQPGQHTQYEAILRTSPEASPYMAATTSTNGSPDAQWATIPSQQPSPTSAFAGSVMQQQQQQQQQQQRMDTSYHTLGDFVTSISAPSHKLTFEHAALYPPELSLNGPGPIRRHRSATPSIAKFGPGVAGVGESIRRPYSAALSESGHGQRSYHPYAVPGHHHVTSHSAQSSPMAYTVPLGANGYEGTPPTSRHGHQTHSRSSSSGGLQEQMRQMLSLEQVQVQQQVEADMAYGSSQPPPQPQAQAQYQMYRTDSPMQYATGTPAETYEMDVAGQHQHQQQEMVQGMYMGGLADAQYAQVQVQQQAYFAHPHGHPHHSL